MTQTANYFTDIIPQIEIKRRTRRDGKSVTFALVPSSRNSAVTYAVGIEHGKAVWCECPDHEYRGHDCKHMIAVHLKMQIDALATYDRTHDQAQVRGNLHQERKAVSVSSVATSSERRLAASGFMR